MEEETVRLMCHSAQEDIKTRLGEISKVDNVAYNSTFAYSVYGTFYTNRLSR